MLDEVEDLDDRRVGHLGEELPLGHRDGLRLGVPGVHQALEHHRSLVDVVVDRQIHPAKTAVRDTTLDLVLVGDHVPRPELRQEGVRAAAVGAPALRQRFAVRSGPSDRLAAVPTEPFRLGDNRIGHQCRERIDLGYARNLHQAAAEPASRRHRAGHRGRVVLWFGAAAGQGDSVVIVETGPEHRLGGRRPHRRGRIEQEVGGLGAGALLVGVSGIDEVLGVGVVLFSHRSNPRTGRSGVPAPGQVPSTTCGTAWSTSRPGGCVPACRLRTGPGPCWPG